MQTPSFEKKDETRVKHHNRFKEHLQKLISVKSELDNSLNNSRNMNTSNSTIFNQKKIFDLVNKTEIDSSSIQLQLPEISITKSFH